MDNLPPNWTTANDTPTGSIENWIRLEEKYKETVKELKAKNKNLEEKLAASEKKESAQRIEVLEAENVIMEKLINSLKAKMTKYEEKIKGIAAVLTEEQTQKKMADLEKERDNWKKLAEEVQKMNAALAQQRNNLLDQKGDLTAKEATATKQRDTLEVMLCELEIDQEALEDKNEELRQQLRAMGHQFNNFKRKLNYDKNNSQRLAECLQSSDRTNAQLKEEIAVLQRQETLASCKICMDRPVQTVFSCGHAACNSKSSKGLL